MSAPPVPPPFLLLAGHPFRWQLLTELAAGDRRVRELTERLGEPQNLVSYHLSQLRSAGLVSRRSSSADRRDSYYRVDLNRCAESLIACGASLHPGVQLTPAEQPTSAPLWSDPVAVLFLCTGNSSRSQMAEAILRAQAGRAVVVASAGSHPKPIHPNAEKVMVEMGLDLSGHRSKHVSELAEGRWDYVITLCDRVREVCPSFPGQPRYTHWSIADPAGTGEPAEATYPAFQSTANELVTRIAFLIRSIEAEASQHGGN